MSHPLFTQPDFPVVGVSWLDAVDYCAWRSAEEVARCGVARLVHEETTRRNERVGFVAHEMRNLLNTALLAFEVLKTGNVGVGGSTGTVLHRSLLGARALTGRSLAEVRLAQGVQHQEQFFVGAFLDDLAPGAAIEGQARGIAWRVLPVADGLVIEADRQILTAVVINLLQNLQVRPT